MKKIILRSILIYSIVLFFRVLANETMDNDSNYSYEFIKIKSGN